MEFPITSSSTSCFHCWEETRAQTRKQRTGFMCVETSQSFRCRDTRSNTHAPREGRREDVFLLDIQNGRKNTRQTKTMVAVEAQELRRRASERQRDGRPGYLARRQQGDTQGKPMRGDAGGWQQRLKLLNDGSSSVTYFSGSSLTQ